MTSTSRTAQSPVAVNGARKIAQGSSTEPMSTRTGVDTLSDKADRRLSQERPSSFYGNSQGNNSYYNLKSPPNNMSNNSGIFGSMSGNRMLAPTQMSMGMNQPGTGIAMNGGSNYSQFNLAGNRLSSIGSINNYSGIMPRSSMVPEEEVIVTKLFSSRRDLDRMASGVDFPRQMSLMWSTYKSMYSEDYGLSRLYSHGSRSNASITGDGANSNEQSKSSMYDHNRSFAAGDDHGSGVNNKQKVSFTTSSTTPAATSASKHANMASRGVGPTGANEAGEAIKAVGRPSTEDASKTAHTNAEYDNALEGVDLTDYVANLVIDDSSTAEKMGKQAKDEKENERKLNTTNAAKENIPTKSTQITSGKQDTVKTGTNTNAPPLDRKKKSSTDSTNVNGGAAHTNATQLKPQSLTATEEMNRVAPPSRKDMIKEVIGNTAQTVADATTTTAAAKSKNNATQSRDTFNPNEKNKNKTNIKMNQNALPPEQSLPHNVLEQKKNKITHDNANQMYTSSVNEKLHNPSTTSEPIHLIATEEKDAVNSVCDLSSLDATSLNNSVIAHERSRGRSLSRRPSRHLSRTTSIDAIDFPVADEVDDDLVKNGLEDVLHNAELEHRAQEREAAKQAAQLTRQRQRELTQRAVKAHELASQQRRSVTELAEVQRRTEIARLDELRRREREQLLAAQAKEREMAKQEFLQRLKEQEQQVNSVHQVKSPNSDRQMNESEQRNNAPNLNVMQDSNRNKISSGHSSNRHKPIMPVGSTLRGVIPAQPPDVIADQVEDTMADGLSSLPHTDGQPPQEQQQDLQRQQKEEEKEERGKETEEKNESSRVMAENKQPHPIKLSSPENVNASLSEKAINGNNVAANNMVHHSHTSVQDAATEAHGATNSLTSPSSAKNTGSSSVLNKENGAHKDKNKEEECVNKDKESAVHAVPKPNLVRTVVLYDELNTATPFKIQDEEVSYNNETCVVKETISIDQMHECIGKKNEINNKAERTSDEVEHTSKRSSAFHRVLEAVCNGYNTALLSLDLPNNSERFQSPIWQVLKWIVSEVERKHATMENVMSKENKITSANTSSDLVNNDHVASNTRSQMGMNIEINCALAYFNDNEVLDLFSANSNAEFKQVSFEPSPIYGPRVKQLIYEPVTSSTLFANRLDAAMCRAASNQQLSQLTTGTVVAYVLLKQVFPLPESMQNNNNINNNVKDAVNEASANNINVEHDVFLSSLTVACAGDDVIPFETAADRTRTCYGEAFHIVLGGPCYTVFALNTIKKHTNDSDSRNHYDKVQVNDNDASNETKEQKIFALLKRLTTYENYALRSGSVRRFIRYVERAKAQGIERVNTETDSTRRGKIERYLKEQQRLIDTATKMLLNPTSMGVR